MFTGIVESTGTVASASAAGDAMRITIAAPDLVAELAPGDSVSVDGACQTVVGLAGEHFRIDTIGTTLSRTTLAGLVPGSRVNLERAMVLGQRLDGHLVQGHVDGIGTLDEVREESGFRTLDFRIPEDVWAQTILHGSIAINGISLTVNALTPPNRCQVGIIPHTWAHTTLPDLTPGDPVNVEGDLIGKYVGRMLAIRTEASQRVTGP